MPDEFLVLQCIFLQHYKYTFNTFLHMPFLMICIVNSGIVVFGEASLRARVFQVSHRSFNGDVLFLPIGIFSHKHSHYTGEWERKESRIVSVKR